MNTSYEELKVIVKGLDREVLVRLFFYGKSCENTTCEELAELVKTVNFFKCAENFNEICTNYHRDDGAFRPGVLKKTWDLLKEAAEDLYILSKTE